MTGAIQRSSIERTPKWQRFQTNLMKSTSVVAKADKETHPYQRQYAHVYHQRLATLGPRCWQQPAVEASKSLKVKRILELPENQPSIAVGTIVKETEGDEIHPQSECRSADTLYLEDESGRVTLQYDKVHTIPTGVVLAVEGTVGSDGVMQVEAVYPPVATPVKSLHEAQGDDACVLLLSGLACGDPSVSPLPRDMLISYLEGRFSVDSAPKIGHVIVAGGSVGASADRVAGIRDLDAFLLQVAGAGIPVDLVPGANDPTTANWPQRPLHHSLLGQTSRYLSRLLSRTPNPYAVEMQGSLVVGTDGTNVGDLVKRILDDDQQPMAEVDALACTLEWSHLCPTGPDSVPTAPHAEFDPMVIDHRPNVYFCGAQQFATRVVDGCRLICVPPFGATGEAVMVHLATGQVELLRFQE